MSLRACIYRNCDSYNIRGVSTPANVTLFQFPKDPERRKKWLELGQVPNSFPDNALFMCSLHFHRKFFCVNNRRTMLIGPAVPYAYVETNKEEHVDENDTEDNPICYDEVVGTEDEIFDEQSISTVSDVDDFQLKPNIMDEDLTNTSEPYDHLKEETHIEKEFGACTKDKDMHTIPQSAERSKVNVNLKRKADSATKSHPLKRTTAKNPASQTAVTSSTVNLSENNDLSNGSNSDKQCLTEEADESEVDDNFIDGSHVTTFIFKGEKYVQMPKFYYVREKDKLLMKIRKLETIIDQIRKSVNTILNANDG